MVHSGNLEIMMKMYYLSSKYHLNACLISHLVLHMKCEL